MMKDKENELNLEPGTIEVSGESIRMARSIMGPNSAYDIALNIAEEYSKEGLHPRFFANYETHTIHVTTYERMNNEFH